MTDESGQNLELDEVWAESERLLRSWRPEEPSSDHRQAVGTIADDRLMTELNLVDQRMAYVAGHDDPSVVEGALLVAVDELRPVAQMVYHGLMAVHLNVGPTIDASARHSISMLELALTIGSDDGTERALVNVLTAAAYTSRRSHAMDILVRLLAVVEQRAPAYRPLVFAALAIAIDDVDGAVHHSAALARNIDPSRSTRLLEMVAFLWGFSSTGDATEWAHYFRRYSHPAWNRGTAIEAIEAGNLDRARELLDVLENNPDDPYLQRVGYLEARMQLCLAEGDEAGAASHQRAIIEAERDRRLGLGEFLGLTLDRYRSEAIEAQTRRLQASSKALADVSQERQDLVGRVAHDVRSSLQVIELGYVSIAETPAVAELIRRAVERIEHLCDQLRFANLNEHAESGQDVDVAAAVIGSVELMEPAVAAKGQRIILDVDPSISLRLDRLLADQVFTNLVSNACKYSPPNTTITVSLLREWSDVVCRVTDQGVGFTAEQTDDLFRRFSRLAPPTGGEFSTGLGLHIVRQACGHLGASVTASSPGPGQGATFTVRLPEHQRKATCA